MTGGQLAGKAVRLVTWDVHNLLCYLAVVCRLTQQRLLRATF